MIQTVCPATLSPLNGCAPIWSADWLASQPASSRRQILSQLSLADLRLIDRHWEFWARPEQLAPDGPWRTWLFLGGRGAGKTRAGAEWLAAAALINERLALVGPTLHDVREVMIDGLSGVCTCAWLGGAPRFESSRRRLLFANGAVAYAFSAEDPESLRGPQFGAAWADEFCAWAYAEETLAMLRMGLRLGDDPRLVMTTTPKPTVALRRLMAEAGVVVTRAGTLANRANLAPGFIGGLQAIYGGTRLAAQELEGQVVEAFEGALWRSEDLARARGPRPEALDQVVVAVDPPASATGDACGLVVAGRLEDRGYVLADLTLSGASPLGWAGRAAQAARDFGAAYLVAEANQGGDMVRTVLAMAGCDVPVRLVHARLGKRARAEPVAALYEQGRITHCGAFPALEEELLALGTEGLDHSPDRADALVWALNELLLNRRGGAPRLSVL